MAEARIEHRYPAALHFLQEHGPTAVAVLEDLLANAERRSNRLVSQASVREIAERLIIFSKDTVHRRLRQLLRAGVLRRLPAKRVAAFSKPAYTFDLTGTGIALTSTPRHRST